MSGRGGKRHGGGRGRGQQQHRQGVKITFNSNRFRQKRDNNEGDDDVPMQVNHRIMIFGFNHNANTEVIRTVLLGKVEGLKFLEFSVQDTKIIATVGTKAEALSLQNLSGTMFGGKKLTLKYLEPKKPPVSGGRPNIREKPTNVRQERSAIDQFIKRHYDADDRMINLSNLANHLPNLNSVDFNNKSFVLQLWDLMANACPDVLTIVLARNNISKLEPFSSMHKYRLKIINISLDDNKITDFEQLSNLKDLSLRELVLTNNPVCAGLDDVTYQLEVVRRLPELGFLDTRKIKQGADSHPLTQLPPIQGNFFDAPNRQALADGFLQKYYEAYDGDRDQLVHAYAEQSCFSLSVVSMSKPTGRGGSSFRGDKFIPYNSLDRNLLTNKSLETRTSTLKTGPTHIVGTILDLPSTKHDYESFTVDCFVSTIGAFEMLNIFVHGSFTESTKAKRSFSRVFLLAPPPAGAKPDGWPVMIINDQLYIRHFTQKRVKAPPPQIPPPVAATPAAAATTQQEMQNLVTRLSSITSMTLTFSEQCLAQNNWNYEAALANFQDLRAKSMIPPEAYIK